MLAGLVGYAIPASAATVRPRVRISYATAKVSQRGVLTIRASVTPKTTSCKLALHGPRSHIVKLAAKRGRSGKIQWTYRVPTTAPAGSWTARATCGKTTSAARAFVVQAPVLKANVAAASDGFTQSNYGDGSQTFISYGAVLHNTATQVDALDLNVAVSFTDTLGRAVATENTTLTAIPAGGTFYLGGLASSNVSLTVASMKVAVTVGSTQSHRLILPPVTGLGFQTDSDGNDSISGTFENPYKQAIPSTANIYVVYLDSQGSVVGGASEFAGASVEPRDFVAFGFSSDSSTINSSFIPASEVSTVDGSIDPCGGIPGGSCPAQLPAQAS